MAEKSTTSLAALKARIEACVTRLAALEERKARAEADLKEAEAALKALGLKPGDEVKAAITKAESDLENSLSEMEDILGLSD
jgi:chaperonin cofactor prefoldin